MTDIAPRMDIADQLRERWSLNGPGGGEKDLEAVTDAHARIPDDQKENLEPIRPGDQLTDSTASRLARLWNQPRLFAVTALLGVSVVPFFLFLAIGYFRGTLVLSGSGHGVLEATAFLTYFPTSGLIVVLVYNAARSLRDTLNSIQNLARFKSQTERQFDSERYQSKLTVTDLNELFRFYEYVIGKLSFHRFSSDYDANEYILTNLPNHESSDHDTASESEETGSDRSRALNENYRLTYLLWFRIPYVVVTLGALGFFFLAAEHHWNAVETYGFRLWSSQEFPVGFAARTGYDFLLYVLIGPFVAVRLIACIYLLHHVMTRLERKRGIRFLRFAIDEAGGFGRFGSQSLKNVFVLVPLVIPIIVSIVFLPGNELTLVGIVVFLLSLPVVFLWPLLGARRSMKRMKQMELEIVSDNLLEQYEFYRRQLVGKDIPENYDELTNKSEAIDFAETVFNGIKNQPAWPFSKTLIGQFLSMMTIIAGSLLSLLTGLLPV